MPCPPFSLLRSLLSAYTCRLIRGIRGGSLGKEAMPTFYELEGAAKVLAQVAKADCCPEYLFWLCDNAARRPEDWGFPRSYSIRPNWTAKDLRREISYVLWRKPTHPKSIAKGENMNLPFENWALRNETTENRRFLIRLAIWKQMNVRKCGRGTKAWNRAKKLTVKQWDTFSTDELFH